MANTPSQHLTKAGLKLQKTGDQTTAAWANATGREAHSNVSIPSDVEVMHAKEWVEENQK